jgi:hypothetical protein
VPMGGSCAPVGIGQGAASGYGRVNDAASRSRTTFLHAVRRVHAIWCIRSGGDLLLAIRFNSPLAKQQLHQKSLAVVCLAARVSSRK